MGGWWFLDRSIRGVLRLSVRSRGPYSVSLYEALRTVSVSIVLRNIGWGISGPDEWMYANIYTCMKTDRYVESECVCVKTREPCSVMRQTPGTWGYCLCSVLLLRTDNNIISLAWLCLCKWFDLPCSDKLVLLFISPYHIRSCTDIFRNTQLTTTAEIKLNCN